MEDNRILTEWYNDFLNHISKEDLIKALDKKENEDSGEEEPSPEIPDKEDHIEKVDKAKIYQVMGLLLALEKILFLLDDEISPYKDGLVEREMIVDKAKKISNTINEIISTL